MSTIFVFDFFTHRDARMRFWSNLVSSLTPKTLPH
uniref:Uncharacterized protein n=1 Tax=Vitis vinifera TaxID=29760 RepID=F6GTU1_VITVI